MTRENNINNIDRKAMRLKRILSIIIIIVAIVGNILAQSIKELDRRAQKYYENKEFSKAIAEWLKILEFDPENEEIQKKIEFVYDAKYKRDISLQKAKLHIKIAKKMIKHDLGAGKSNVLKALKNFTIAYRIDPMDPDILMMKEAIRELDEIVKIEEAKIRLSNEIKDRYYALLSQANREMELQRYNQALKYWKEILSLVPIDKVAKEGKRRAELAISNRLKFERVKSLLEAGISLFQLEKYKESKLDFEQALMIDPVNKEAKSYIKKIDEILEERRNYELKRIQAEQFYISGVENLRRKNFDEAEEDFQNVLALIDNFKDVVEKLSSIKRLRKEYEEQDRIRKLRKIDKTFQSGLLALAEGKYRDAIMFFEATLSLDPNNSLANRYMTSSKEALKQLEEEMVDENSPYYDVVNSLVLSGKLLYERGEYIESRKRWEKILKLFPKNRIATEYLLKCNLQLKPPCMAGRFAV